MVDSDFQVRCVEAGLGKDPEGVRKRLGLMAGGLLIQTAAVEMATNELYVEMLVAQTYSAIEAGKMLARKKEVDLLLRLAGTTQISAAIAKAGAKGGKPFLLIIAGSADDVAAAEPELRAIVTRLKRRELDEQELGGIETAALLNALKG